MTTPKSPMIVLAVDIVAGTGRVVTAKFDV